MLSKLCWLLAMNYSFFSLFFPAVKNKLTESLSKEFFKNQVSFINSDYGNSRHVSYRCNLDVGRYLLMATTYEPGEESGKRFRIDMHFIFSSHHSYQLNCIMDCRLYSAIVGQSHKTSST